MDVPQVVVVRCAYAMLALCTNDNCVCESLAYSRDKEQVLLRKVLPPSPSGSPQDLFASLKASLGLQAQEEYARSQIAEIDLKRRCSAPVGGDWRLPPALPEDFSVALNACRPSYPHSIQSQSRGASSQDSEASQPIEPSQKCATHSLVNDR